VVYDVQKTGTQTNVVPSVAPKHAFSIFKKIKDFLGMGHREKTPFVSPPQTPPS